MSLTIATCVFAISRSTALLKPLHINSEVRMGYEPPLSVSNLGHADEDPSQIIDVTMLVPVDTPPQEVAFLTQEVDAVTTYDLLLSQLQVDSTQVLFDNTQTSVEMVDCLAGLEDVINVHGQQLQRVIEGWFKGLDYSGVQIGQAQ